jgi:hypothetical protein
VKAITEAGYNGVGNELYAELVYRIPTVYGMELGPAQLLAETVARSCVISQKAIGEKGGIGGGGGEGSWRSDGVVGEKRSVQELRQVQKKYGHSDREKFSWK